MKRLFTLAIIAMIASLTFAQAPTAVKKAKTNKIEKVVSTAQMSKAMEAKAVEQAKAQAAQEQGTTVVRHAAKPAPKAAQKQMASQKVINGVQVTRPSPMGQYAKLMKGAAKSFKNVKHNAAPVSKMAVAKSEGDYVDLVADSYSAEYYSSSADWYVTLTVGSYQFYFDIYTGPEPLDGTYTWDQMDDYYSCLGSGQSWIDDFSDATFIADAETGNVEAYCTLLEDGSKYHITYTKPEIPEITAYETVEFSADEAELSVGDGLFQILAENADGYYASIAVLKEFVPGGTYTLDDCYDSYTNLYLSFDDYTGVKPFALNATVTENSATVVYDAYNGVEYTLIFHFATEGDEPGDEPGDVTVTKDANGIITSVEGGEPKAYTRSTDGTAYFVNGSSMSFGTQSGVVTVIEDGDKVYIKDPITRYTQGSWVEGTKNGNMVVVPAGQPLAYSDQYGATISLRYGVITAAGTIDVADDYAENFVFTVDGDTWTLENTAAWDQTADAYFMGAFWDDDDSATGYGDAETVLTYDPTYVAPSTDLVELPAGAQVEEWNMSGVSVTSSSQTPFQNQAVNVAFVGNDVYAQGVFSAFPEAWVKGTKSGSTVTFSKLQYIGNYGGSYDMYFAGTDGQDLTDATATLSADAQTLTFNESLLANAATDRIYYLTWLDDVVISATPAEEPVITDLTAELPYFNGFDSEAEQAEAAIYDANGDGKTFTFAEDSKTSSTAARYTYSGSNDGDDYVVFPGLALTAGTSYKVSVDARAYGTTYPERFEVVVGNVAKASELTTSVIEPTDVATGDYATFTGEFVPETSGTYFFAIHGISDADMFYLYTDNFSVSENNPNIPVAVADLAVTPEPNAGLTAVIEFTAPAKTIGGEDIAENVKMDVKRDGEVVFANVTVPAGEFVQLMDINIPAPGFYTYSVTATVGDLTSDAATAKVYVGEDIPDDVENLVAADLDGKVGLSWTAPVDGINGGIILPENLKYNVYPVEMVEFWGMTFPEIDFENPYMTGLTETSAEVEYDTNAGAQAYTYFGVTAENTAGETNGAMAAVLTGAPYELPFVEEFPNGLTYWWGVDYDDNIYNAEGGLGITEAGELVFEAPVAGWIELMSGKIALNGVENPALSFSYKSDANATLQVQVVTPEGEEIVGMLPVEASDEYVTANIDLSFYADQPWVRFNLIGEFEEATELFVDNFILMDMVQNDLQIAVSAPKSVTAGKTAVVKATVKNVGQATAENYEVKFYVNDTEAPAPMFETPALAFMETAEFEFELETSIFDEAGDVTVKAEVVYDADEKDVDNADEVVVEVVAPSATPVKSVSAENTAEGVLVSWTVADNAAQETTEDFESYEVGIYTDSMGAWTGKDGDQGMGYGWQSSSIAWDYTGEPYAFAIMNFPNVFGSATDIEATSGEQALMFMSVTDEAGAGFPADDWFISPELPGVAQTISFQARPMTAQYGAEELEVMASEDGQTWTKVANFSLEEEAFVECTANLAEGTKYFALHYVSNDIFCAFVDDLKYTVGGANPTGFNVYVDQNLVAAVDAETTSYTYTDELSQADHDFSVTAVYGNSESAPVTVTLGVTTGIKNITDAQNVEVYTIDGIRMNGVKNLKAGVYVVNGQKVVIK